MIAGDDPRKYYEGNNYSLSEALDIEDKLVRECRTGDDWRWIDSKTKEPVAIGRFYKKSKNS